MQIKNCPLCHPQHEIYVEGEDYRVLCTSEPNHYILASREHLPCTASALSKCRWIFDVIGGMGWPMEIVIQLNGHQMGVNHLSVHLYRRPG